MFILNITNFVSAKINLESLVIVSFIANFSYGLDVIIMIFSIIYILLVKIFFIFIREGFKVEKKVFFTLMSRPVLIQW